jgi:hypothetical protein
VLSLRSIKDFEVTAKSNASHSYQDHGDVQAVAEVELWYSTQSLHGVLVSGR